MTTIALHARVCRIMRWTFQGATVACLLLAASCQPSLEDEASALLQTDSSFAAASIKVGMAEAFSRFMAPDGMQLRPGSDPIVGPVAIKKRMSAAKDIILSWSPKAAEVSQSCDLGYTWGTYTVERQTAEGRTLLGSGKYLNVWRKQSDGKWKVLVDIGNEDPSPEDGP